MLRHQASTDLSDKGLSGFRSSEVKDEMERLVVTKRDREGSVDARQRKPRSARMVLHAHAPSLPTRPYHPRSPI